MIYTIGKLSRLRKRKDFSKVFDEGVFATNAMFAIHLLPNPDKKRRVGFTAGKKIGSAVVRNRCKRRLRECYRLYQNEVPCDMDMVIVARRALLRAKWNDIVKGFLEAVQRTRTIAEKKRGRKL